MAEISDITVIERTIEINHPKSGEPLGISVTVMSMDDDRMKRIKRAITDRKLHLDARGKGFKAEDIEENRNNILFSAMTGWNWAKDTEGEQNTFHGEVPDFTKRNVIAVFEEMSWFRDQIDGALGDEKAFFTSSNVS